jgi:hypothetical protein
MVHSSDGLCGSVLSSDTGDLKARKAEVSQFTIGEPRQFADGLAIAVVSTDLGEKISHEHGKILHHPASAAGAVSMFADLHMAVRHLEKKLNIVRAGML